MAKTHRTHPEATAEMLRRDPDLAGDYLNSVLDDGDETDFLLALRNIQKAFGDEQNLARIRSDDAVTMTEAEEIRSIIETLHLLRSPKNASRLLGALTRARASGYGNLCSRP